METQYYIRHRGVVRGPYTADRLIELARRHQFGRHYELSRDGENWESAGNHPELLPAPKLVKVRKALQGSPAATETGYELAEPETAEAGSAADGGELRLEPDSGGQSWYYAVGGEECGPVSLAELKAQVAAGQIQFDDLVWTAGLGKWIPASSAPGLFPEEALADPAGWQAVQQMQSSGGEQVTSLEQPPAPRAPLSPLAIASFVSGLLGLPTCSLGSIPAVILGHMALRQIALSRGALGGRGLALAGLITGYATIGITILTLMVAILAKLISMLSGSNQP